MNLKWIAVTPARWSTPEQIAQDLIANAPRYLAQFTFWLVAISIALKTLGFRAARFVPAFIFLYVLAVAIFAIGQWDQASAYNLEPPLVALLVGLVISNLIGLPRWLDDGFRVEFYVKIGIVLLGATLPLALIVWAGPIAILQASIVSVATFLVIFWASRCTAPPPSVPCNRAAIAQWGRRARSRAKARGFGASNGASCAALTCQDARPLAYMRICWLSFF